MSENKYKKRFEFQNKMIARQSEQIDALKLQIDNLESKLKEKDEIIKTVEPMRKEMTENIKECKRLKNEYQNLIDELKKMKNIINQEVFKNKWWLVKFLLK